MRCILTASLLSLAHAQTIPAGSIGNAASGTQVPASTAAAPGGLTPAKECEAAGDKVLAIWASCGVTYTSKGVSIPDKPAAAKCMCDNYSVAEAAFAKCESSVLAAELGTFQQILSDFKLGCGDAQTSGQVSTRTDAQANVKSGAAAATVYMGFAMVLAFAIATLVN
ncbi:hypothetical protein HDU80_010045 [Chytriomyces hyalinus]|nr:hypothetical protein HDU80_010045 [Chytriomyces hyalinus]